MTKADGERDRERTPQDGPGSGIIILLGVVAVTAMLFGLIIGLLF